MTYRKPVFRLSFAALGLVVLFFMAPANRAQATDPTCSQLVIEEAGFSDALTKLADRFNFRFIANGVPKRQKATIRTNNDAKSALDALCEAFDLRWRHSKGGTVLLTKRFSNPNDLPQAILPELRVSATALKAAIPPGEPSFDHNRWGSILVALSALFTPRQREALSSGIRLRFADLTEPQRRLLEEAIRTRGFGMTLGAGELLEFRMRNAESSRIDLVDLASGKPVANDFRGRVNAIQYCTDGNRTAQMFLGQLER